MAIPIAAALAGAGALAMGGGIAKFKLTKNAAEAGMPDIDKIPDTIKPYLEPYINRSNSAYDVLNPQYNNMASNPVDFLNSLIQQYQPSRTYQLRRDAALGAAGNTAAAGGMRGSLSDISNQAGLSDSLLGEDMQQWLQNVLGIHGAGLQGQQGFYNQGAAASQSLADSLANVLGTKSQLNFNRVQQGNADRNALISALTGGASQMLMGGAGGGGGGGMMNLFQGAAGARAGNNFMNTTNSTNPYGYSYGTRMA